MWSMGSIPIMMYVAAGTLSASVPVTAYLLITNSTNLLLADGTNFMKLAGN